MNDKSPRSMTSEELPPHLRAELGAMLQSLAQKYGERSVRLGTHIENLAMVCTAMADPRLDNATREVFASHAHGVCLSVIQDLGRAWNVDPNAAFNVAKAIHEYSRHAETEMLGEQPVSAEVADAAAAVLAKAKAA